MEDTAMKVLLIKPPYTRLKGVGQAPYFPLGLGYVSAVLNQDGFNACIYHAETPHPGENTALTDADIGFDFRSRSYRRYRQSLGDDDHYIWQEVTRTLEGFQPDVVGISVLSVETASAFKLSRLVKGYRQQCAVVWGGVHPSFLPDDCLKNPEVDFAVRGEGEHVMLELCRLLRRGAATPAALSEIGGLSFKDNGRVIHNPASAASANLDALPFPDRHNVLYRQTIDFKSLGSMIVSRGCPFRCTFCSSRNFWDKKVRLRSPENVISEIAFLQNTYGTRHIMFWDDSFTINRKVIERYCRSIIDSGLKISWKTATRADLIDEELLDLMQRAGCVKLEIGVESGSERIKRMINKDVSNSDILRAFALLRKKGIGSGAFFMAGFPEETLGDLQETFDFMRQLNADELAFNIFDPMPGSSEYDKCIELGLISGTPDWNDFPLWPDAYFVKDIDRQQFDQRVEEIARWLYAYNNSLTVRLRRSRQHLLFLLKNDPAMLLKKTFGYLIRRLKVHRTKTNTR
ncbi:MAG: B12-binding domain-containing radical SAM protein [Magnetococcales bacterium]|nr:B12-binding domain-containing radical SAM protein [Nitrospirota bacterium]